jgi:hypothetical protein
MRVLLPSLLAGLSGIRQGKKLREWANMKTLEICYWIPGIDDAISAVPEDERRKDPRE